MIKTTHNLEHRVEMRAKIIWTKTINLMLSFCGVQFLWLSWLSVPSKKKDGHFLEALSLVLFQSKLLPQLRQIPIQCKVRSTKTCVRVGVHPNNWLTNIQRLVTKTIFSHYFTSKNFWTWTEHVCGFFFSNFLSLRV